MFDSVWSFQKDINRNTMSDINDIDIFSVVTEYMNLENQEEYINPKLSDLYDPFLLPNMGKACDRILEAIDNCEKIAIFGDYDVDGITATAVLYDFLKKTMDADVSYYLPNRFDGGYGLSKEVIDKVIDDGITLIITVDNGISSKDDIAYAYSRGINVVVTDHHEIPEELPSCHAIVNPHLPESVYPTKGLCGCAVAYKLCEAIAISVGLEDQSIYLPLVSLATISDVMRLTGENRTLVKLGLREMSESAFPGLNLLVKNAITNKDLKEITAGDVGFSITPKLNAAGRIQDPTVALKLFLAETDRESLKILNELDELNNVRKTTADNEFQELSEHPELIISSPNAPVVIIKSKTWNHGINGVIAPRVMNQTGKSCIVLVCDDDIDIDPEYKGSARAVDDVSIIEALEKSRNILESLGGHDKACGLTIRESQIPEFVRRTEESISAQIKSKPVVPNRELVSYLPSELISIETVKKISKLEPFGEGAKPPIFITDGIESFEVQQLGQNKTTTKFFIGFSGDINVTGINFDSSRFFLYNKVSVPLAVVYTLSLNYFGGKVTPQLVVLDIIEGKNINRDCLYKFSYDDRLSNCEKSINESFRFSKEELADFYRYFKSIGTSFTFNEIAGLKTKLIKSNDPNKYLFSWFKINYALKIFNEIGLINITSQGKYEISDVNEKKDINVSKIYNELRKD